MKLRIDRLEGDYVVCEDCDSNKIINLEKALFSNEPHSGDLIELLNDKITFLPNSDMEERIKEKMSRLWK